MRKIDMVQVGTNVADETNVAEGPIFNGIAATNVMLIEIMKQLNSMSDEIELLRGIKDEGNSNS